MAGAAVTEQPVDLRDVQGLIAHAYQHLPWGRYLLFRIPADAAPGRWLRDLCARVTPAQRESSGGRTAPVVNVAFTADGLRALDLDENVLLTFSREFLDGMTTRHRQRVLGDEDDLAPQNWDWGGPGKTIHGMLFLFAAGERERDDLCRYETAVAAQHGVEIVGAIDGELHDGREHFGFVDGRSQPYFRELDVRRTHSDVRPEDVVPLGEVLLGYHNAYDQPASGPEVPDEERARGLAELSQSSDGQRRRDLGRNGTYVVFRQLAQDVQGFWRFVLDSCGGDRARLPELAARLMGRHLDGRPLVRAAPPAHRQELQGDVRYREDRQGHLCPLGSHVRRANPRDGLGDDPALSLRVSRAHRLLRRGRTYGPPVHDSFDPQVLLDTTDAQPRGLSFVAFNTNIARQFEFVQSTWVNSPKFSGLYCDPDPVVAPHVPAAGATFTIQSPVRQRLTGLRRFVSVRGGAYLFMPGRKALQYLAVVAVRG